MEYVINTITVLSLLPPSPGGDTPQHIEIAQLLIKHGSKINVMDRWKFTPLHEAAQKGRTQLCSLLVRKQQLLGSHLIIMYCLQISHGADVNLRNQENQTPYDLATVSE